MWSFDRALATFVHGGSQLLVEPATAPARTWLLKRAW
jgi:hypothetical protein